MKDAAQKIDHRLPPPAAAPEGRNIEHGKYVANMCTGCHRADFEGGKIPGAPPDWPVAAKLAPVEGSAMAGYDTPEKFLAMMQTGKRPDRTPISPVMPFETLRAMSDVDVEAMRLYLRSLLAAAN